MLTRRQAIKALCAAAVAAVAPIPAMGAAVPVMQSDSVEVTSSGIAIECCCGDDSPVMDGWELTVDRGPTYTLKLQPDGSYLFEGCCPDEYIRLDGDRVTISGL